MVRERARRHINRVPRTNTAQTRAKWQSMNESKCTRKHVDQCTTPLAECRQHLMNGYGKGFHVITARRCSTRDSLLLLSSSGIRGRLLHGRLSPSLDTSLPRRSACEITQRRLQGGTESPRSAAPRKPAAPTRKHAASSDGVPGTACGRYSRGAAARCKNVRWVGEKRECRRRSDPKGDTSSMLSHARIRVVFGP